MPTSSVRSDVNINNEIRIGWKQHKKDKAKTKQFRRQYFENPKVEWTTDGKKCQTKPAVYHNNYFASRGNFLVYMKISVARLLVAFYNLFTHVRSSGRRRRHHHCRLEMMRMNGADEDNDHHLRICFVEWLNDHSLPAANRIDETRRGCNPIWPRRQSLRLICSK